nr:PREDICTED: gamma-butyrobetaine dioxygenase [Lepisosteus oculatus]
MDWKGTVNYSRNRPNVAPQDCRTALGHLFPELQRDHRLIADKQYWGSELRIPTASFEEVLSDDKAAYSWLTTLRRVGIVYLKGAPAEQGQVARLSDRIGYLRLTFYGTFRHPCGAEVFGEVLVNWLGRRDVSGRLSARLWERVRDARLSPPAGSVDADGQVVRINYNNATRDSVLDAPLEQIQPFYGALKAFVDLMGRPQNLVTYRMEPGDVVTFDNWRLLHGRRSYVSTRGTPRHLEGAYLDWDEVMSRLRILGKAIRGDS